MITDVIGTTRAPDGGPGFFVCCLARIPAWEAGTYVYILRVRDAAGEWQLFKGHVVVLR